MPELDRWLCIVWRHVWLWLWCQKWCLAGQKCDSSVILADMWAAGANPLLWAGHTGMDCGSGVDKSSAAKYDRQRLEGLLKDGTTSHMAPPLTNSTCHFQSQNLIKCEFQLCSSLMSQECYQQKLVHSSTTNVSSNVSFGIWLKSQERMWLESENEFVSLMVC